MTQSRVQGSEPLLWLLRFMRWDHICTRWSWGILCKYLVSWLRVGALEGCQGSALPGGNAFYAMCYLCFVCVCRSAWVYGVCVTVLSLCLVYSVQPFFQYISVPEFPSCLLISSNFKTTSSLPVKTCLSDTWSDFVEIWHHPSERHIIRKTVANRYTHRNLQ